MTITGVRRKLSAILSADVKGYSRLMGEDEMSTVRTLKEYRIVITQLIQTYRGRVVDAIGDNLLAEFGSVVDAAQCAVAIQDELKEQNALLSDHRKMEFRNGRYLPSGNDLHAVCELLQFESVDQDLAMRAGFVAERPKSGCCHNRAG